MKTMETPVREQAKRGTVGSDAMDVMSPGGNERGGDVPTAVRTIVADRDSVDNGITTSLAAGSEITAHSGPGKRPVIRGIGINKRYVMSKDNYVDALQDASLEIHRGEMVGVMGPSGSGKSTLLHILGCLDSASSGEVWLDGRRVDDLSRRELARLRRNEVGFIFQTFNLVPSLSAIENVMLAAEYAGKSRREAREAARKALVQVGLDERANHRPTELSGGQQQRVAIARALVNRPKVIFGDEPTGNLDSVSSAEIVAMMHRINRDTGTTFVLVTHDPGVAETCDRVFHMLDGRVTNGPHA
jgi:putative ABC transport system ATP-binding protein